MRVISVLALSVALACCAPEAAEGPRTAKADEGCQAAAQAMWSTPAGPLALHAAATGPSCAQAVASLVVRSGSGDPVFAEIYPVESLFGFETAATAESMQQALAAWIAPDSSPLRSSVDLPPWRPGAEQPESGEFPFYPSEQYADPSAYEALRAQGLPIFCYPQGRESMACLVLRDGALESVGLQTFPG